MARGGARDRGRGGGPDGGRDDPAPGVDGGGPGGGLRGVRSLADLSVWWDRSERWILWGLTFAATLGAVLGGLAVLVQQWRGRPSRWPPDGGRRLRLVEDEEDALPQAAEG